MDIECDCSDCGFGRVRGPCMLEEYYSNESNEFLNEMRTLRKKNPENNLRYRKNRPNTLLNTTRILLSISHISIV